MAATLSIPRIHLREPARKVLLDALADGHVRGVRLRIDEHFAHEFFFERAAEGDITVEADGIKLLLDPASAERADGLSVDFTYDLHGAGFHFDNPNKPGYLQPIELTRDCAVTLIPGGERLQLGRGERVVVTQALGGSFTVQISRGRLARIAAADADALGRDAQRQEQPQTSSGGFDVQQVFDMLRTVYDPEIPVNVVDLGLIYQCETRLLADGGQRVEIKMSMTAPGCGMGDVLKEEALTKVRSIPGVSEVEVEIVWDPPWDQSRMSEAARLQLGLF
ncbi:MULTISPECIES: putative Fe-S cluster assembly protein SufT [unclassified Pseudomonas]|uniref:putative Fe-S cluster assembly protein SufT n=1 Tax=unclassified Pseudomonas TaxID=196821 RepID=UPI0015B018FE|nr:MULTISPECIES: putative Fe-S cluster assembly protein SufT [unclassified Pseudomonas]